MHRLICVLIIFILTTFTQTPRDMYCILDASGALHHFQRFQRINVNKLNSNYIL